MSGRPLSIWPASVEASWPTTPELARIRSWGATCPLRRSDERTRYRGGTPVDEFGPTVIERTRPGYAWVELLQPVRPLGEAPGSADYSGLICPDHPMVVRRALGQYDYW